MDVWPGSGHCMSGDRRAGQNGSDSSFILGFPFSFKPEPPRAPRLPLPFSLQFSRPSLSVDPASLTPPKSGLFCVHRLCHLQSLLGWASCPKMALLGSGGTWRRAQEEVLGHCGPSLKAMIGNWPLSHPGFLAMSGVALFHHRSLCSFPKAQVCGAHQL